MGGLNRVRGLNERMPLHKEIDVSMCNGILRIWLGHFGSSAHLIGDRMVSFETIRSQGVGRTLDLGGPDPRDRMVSFETIRSRMSEVGPPRSNGFN